MKDALWHRGKIDEAQHAGEEHDDAQMQPVIIQPTDNVRLMVIHARSRLVMRQAI